VLRGKPNEPANVVHTARSLAVQRRVSYEEFDAAIGHSAAAAFGW
jgi:Tat protein secretion system quality control protein TatD with DNase activity